MRQMKDSGIEWIGEIPQRCKCVAVNKLYTLILGKMLADSPKSKSDTFEQYLCAMNVHFDGIDETNLKKMWFSQKEKSLYKVNDGDLLIVEGGAGAGGAFLAENMRDKNIYIQNSIIIAREKKSISSAKFLYYAIYSLVTRNYIDFICNKATIPHFTKEKIGNTKIVFFPFPEQQRIADYLDAQCARIDETMELVRQSKEKLRAYKLSLITEAVTKGLDPDVPMKDSGIPWIGEIPAEWEIGKLKKYASTLTPMRDKPEFLDGDIPWIRIEDFSGKYIEKSKEGLGVSRETVKSMNLKIYPIGTILCTSSCDLGKCAITSVELVSNQRFIGIIPNKNCHPDFLYYIIRSSAERLNFLSTGSIQANLSRAAFEHLQLQFPPLPEQQRIAAYLDEKCARIDALLAEKDELLDKLAEYKKSLIFECVTGKREVAA